jgi:hypothetical protein
VETPIFMRTYFMLGLVGFLALGLTGVAERRTLPMAFLPGDAHFCTPGVRRRGRLHEDTFLRPSAVLTAAFRYWEIARSCSILSSMALVEDVASRSVAPEVFNRACICSGDPEQVTH